MQRRHDKTNIPIELLRSFVAIQEHGSFTKAASDLHLTQPAISAQMKRLREIVGGEIFSKDGQGGPLTEKGKTVGKYARRILAMNDQIMSLSGAKQRSRRLRVGIPSVFAAHMLSDIIKASAQADIQLCCAPSGDLARNLASGYLDLAMILSTAPLQGRPVFSREEKLIWMSSRELVLSPGAPVPILSWPSSAYDQAIVESLEEVGQHYAIVFVASDLAAHIAAIRLGLGYFVFPERVAPSDFTMPRRPYLPKLPSLITGLYLREGLDERSALPLVKCFDKLLASNQALEKMI